MVISTCNDEVLTSKVGFFPPPFINDKDEAQFKKKDTITIKGYVS